MWVLQPQKGLSEKQKKKRSGAKTECVLLGRDRDLSKLPCAPACWVLGCTVITAHTQTLLQRLVQFQTRCFRCMICANLMELRRGVVYNEEVGDKDAGFAVF